MSLLGEMRKYSNKREIYNKDKISHVSPTRQLVRQIKELTRAVS